MWREAAKHWKTDMKQKVCPEERANVRETHPNEMLNGGAWPQNWKPRTGGRLQGEARGLNTGGGTADLVQCARVTGKKMESGEREGLYVFPFSAVWAREAGSASPSPQRHRAGFWLWPLEQTLRGVPDLAWMWLCLKVYPTCT